MTPDEELEALRRLAELQGTGQKPAPELPFMEKAKIALDAAGERASQVGKYLGRGVVNTAGGFYDALSNAGAQIPQTNIPALLGKMAVDRALGGQPNPQAVADSIYKVPPDEPKAETYNRRAMEGLPTALIGGGRAPLVSALSSMLGPMAGQAAGDYAKGVSPSLAPLADTLANVGVQAGMGLATGIKRGWPSADAQEAAQDTGVLTNMALNRAGPEKGGLSVANATSDAANALEKGAAKQASDAFGAIVQGARIRASEAASIHRYLLGEASRIESTGVGQRGEAEALRKIADQFLRGNKQGYITDVPTLSLQIKQFKLDPNQSSISENNLKSAIATAERALENFSPEFANANRAFSQIKQTVEKPLKEGVIGRLSDSNPYAADPTSPGRLNALVKDVNPAEQQQALAQLASRGASAEDIARAIMAKRVEGGGLAPGAKVFGGPGSAQETALNTVLQSAGKSPEQVRAPLDAADAIARSLTRGNTALTESVRVHPQGISLAGVARPGITEKIKSAFVGSKGSQEIVKLIETAGPAEIAQLEKLANYDPQIRLALTLAGIGRGALPNMSNLPKD